MAALSNCKYSDPTRSKRDPRKHRVGVTRPLEKTRPYSPFYYNFYVFSPRNRIISCNNWKWSKTEFFPFGCGKIALLWRHFSSGAGHKLKNSKNFVNIAATAPRQDACHDQSSRFGHVSLPVSILGLLPYQFFYKCFQHLGIGTNQIEIPLIIDSSQNYNERKPSTKRSLSRKKSFIVNFSEFNILHKIKPSPH